MPASLIPEAIPMIPTAACLAAAAIAGTPVHVDGAALASLVHAHNGTTIPVTMSAVADAAAGYRWTIRNAPDVASAGLALAALRRIAPAPYRYHGRAS